MPTPPPEIVEEPVKPIFAAAVRRSVLEQQAALNFAQLATQDGAPDGAQVLIDALVVSLSFFLLVNDISTNRLTCSPKHHPQSSL
jgi:hypothetical protein